MPPVTGEQLRAFVDRYQTDTGSSPTPVWRAYFAACTLLRHHLGQARLDAQVMGLEERRSPFLIPRPETELDRARHLQRVTALGEALFNLQAVPGFDGQARRLRTEDLESVAAELDSATLLHGHAGVPIRFVPPAGAAGSDYDIDAVIGPHTAACETKCKVAATECDERTVYHSLEQARKQLPKGRPGVVLLKLPEHWLRSAEMDRSLAAALERKFRQTGRVSAVVAHCEEWDATPDHFARLLVARTAHNPNADVPLGEFGDLVPDRFRSPHWQSLNELMNP
ncbi:MAG TPA: hypothetical protein VIL46_13280 [Gemmataceae bacterium]